MKIRVGVLRGGRGSNYERSLADGLAVLRHMPGDFEAVDIFVDRDGVWHVSGVALPPENVAQRVDIVYSALGEEAFETGGDAAILEHLVVPFVGSGRFSHALARDRVRAGEVFSRAFLKTPPRTLFNANEHTEDDIFNIFRTTPQPSIVRTRTRLSSHTSLPATSYGALVEALSQTGDVEPDIVIEAHIEGDDVMCIVLENFRGEELYTLPVVEATSDGYMYPPRFSREELDEVARIAREAHKALGARHFSQTHARISPRGVYVIETTLTPDHRDDGALHKGGDAVGLSRMHFLKHMVEQALG
ncbi:MAG: hypothetical protein AAB458_01455 [Patescibacteria group bacterium]